MNRCLRSVVLGGSLVVSSMFAAVDNIHFLIPGGAGGGWDGTARGTGEALYKSGLVKNVSFENMSGGGGGKAIGYIIETAKKQKGTLLVNSTPIIARSLQKVFPYSFRDLTPIASIISDYGALVVRADSKYKTYADVLKDLKKDPRSVKMGGASSKGSLDHLVPAIVYKASGIDPLAMRYISYNGEGGKATAGLLNGELDVLATGFGEVIDKHKSGQVRIIGVTSNESINSIPSFKSMGYDAFFANWRGFFAVPNLEQSKVDEYADVLKKMYDTKEWEAVRARNGWTNLYQPKGEFVKFLEKQEKDIKTLMTELGFL